MTSESSDPLGSPALRALYEALARASQEAGAMQAMLEEAIAVLSVLSDRVTGVVGGSTQQIDKQIVQALQEAVRHSHTAVSALQTADSSTRTIR